MVERPKANIKLYKSERLHGGSYRKIGGAKNDRLLFAAKAILPPLFDRTTTFLLKNCKECHLILQLRHHNVAQYLAICYSPYTRLPVLLTGLCDESVTAFLERFPGPLPYHIRVNISHDIALALAYLHNKSLTDRDLRGKNVMIMAGTRAKIADFRMSGLPFTLDQCNKQPKVEETSIQKALFEEEYQAGTRAKIADFGMSGLAFTLDQCNKQPKVEETSIQKALFEEEYQAGTRAKI
ncbi:Probable serine/threonine-protein kinase kinY, partial [Geodia barretti]